MNFWPESFSTDFIYRQITALIEKSFMTEFRYFLDIEVLRRKAKGERRKAKGERRKAKGER
jgi:hypothetical protein